MASGTSLVEKRDMLVKDLEVAITKRNQLKTAFSDPAEFDKLILGRVATLKEKIGLLDINDRSFMSSYVGLQARIDELGHFLASLHAPDKECDELQKGINSVQALIDEREKISKREQY